MTVLVTLLVELKDDALFALCHLDCGHLSPPESAVFCFLRDVTCFRFKFLFLLQQHR